MKKLLLFVFAITASTTTMFAQTVGDTFTDGGINYTVTSVAPNECEVSGHGDTAIITDLVIPMDATDSGAPATYTVTRVGMSAFDNNAPNLVNVTLPTTVTSLGFRAFHKAYAIETINLENVVSLDNKDVFARNEKISEVDFSSLTFMGQYAFYNSKALGAIELPVIETLEGNLFENSGLTSVNFGSSLTTITGTNQFKGCGSLGAIKLNWTAPGDIVSIVSADMFPGLSGITVYVEPGMAASYTGTGWDDFTIEEGEIPLNIGVQFSEGDFDYLITGGSTASLIGTTNDILDFATVPMTAAFDGDDYTITAVAASAFQGHANLTQVDLPSTIKTIGNDAFRSCPSLTSLDTADIVSIGENILNGSHNVTTLDLSELVIMGRNGLGRSRVAGILDLPKVTEIKEWAFYETEITTLNLPSTLVDIQTNSLHTMANLTTINIEATTPPVVSDIGSGTEFGLGTTNPALALNVPTGTKGDYEAAAGWQVFTNVLGVNNVVAQNFNLFPNPTNGTVTVRNSTREDMTISVFDLNGRTLLNTTNSQVDMSGLASGVYLFKIKTANAEVVKRVLRN